MYILNGSMWCIFAILGRYGSLRQGGGGGLPPLDHLPPSPGAPPLPPPLKQPPLHKPIFPPAQRVVAVSHPSASFTKKERSVMQSTHAPVFRYQPMGRLGRRAALREVGVSCPLPGDANDMVVSAQRPHTRWCLTGHVPAASERTSVLSYGLTPASALLCTVGGWAGVP